MRIGILGAGDMADALGTQWVRAGHEVMVSGRDHDKAVALAERMTAEPPAESATAGSSVPTATAGSPVPSVAAETSVQSTTAGSLVGSAVAGTWAEVAEFGEVVVVAVREAGLVEVLQAAGPALRGKPLIDVTNAASLPAYDPARPLAKLIGDLTGGHVVKAFNLCHVDVWRHTPPVFGGRPLAVPLCGDDPAALAAARRLASDLGCTPVDGGGLERATLLEATAAFVIGLWFGGVDAQAILPPWQESGAHPTT
ncbi:NAD(P)-binding domain-containing protein [Nonomuraea sp. NN258]|uniref:NADPH-dependent F420 reductase n=1 Tax=Nonomuraea antri TaxID=2730852 RepID=UPI0015698722|nr:NAD(P)-binding domain-containing protein [Nonomuraea antri]NRQ40118.1 NAD(P)-binding domain-containing protein [Nonomuraea antri]